MHRTTVAAVFLVMSFFASGFSWPGDSFALELLPTKIEQVAGTRDDTCMGSLTLKRIDGVGERLLCATATAHAGAHFLHGSAKPLAFRLKHDPVFYEVTNICRGGGCVYAPETDVLWEKRLDSGINYSLHRYDNFAQHLHPLRESGIGRWLYEYRGASAPRVYSGVNAFGVSENGEWVGVEVRNKGIILISSQDNSIRRVAPLLHHYGRGYDPTYEIAIQNDGTRLFLAGLNVSPALIQVTNRCGDTVVVGVSLGTTFSSGVTPCPIEVQSFVPTLPVYRYTHHPRFDGDDSLRLLVRSMSGADYLFEKRFSISPERKLAYIAMGDSFTSGEGEEDDGYYLPGTNTPENRCHISGRSYPFLLVKTPLPMVSVACSGAITDHLLEPYGTLPAQLSVVRAHQPDVVTTSIGGNDLDLVGKLAACAGPGTCVWARPEHRILTAREASMLRGRLVDVFTEVRDAAPIAQHYIIGYPFAIDPLGSCDVVTKLLLNADERRYLYEAQKLLNSVVASAAQQVSVKYVDVSEAFMDTALCSNSANPAMNGLRFGDDLAPISGFPRMKIIGNESFHPNPFGHRLLATLVDASIAEGPSPQCGSGACQAPPLADYWAESSDDVLVYRLTHERLPSGTIQIESSGQFAAGSTIAASLFSEEVDLGTFTADALGAVSISFDAAQLGNETHTVLLKGVNHRNQTIVGYAIVRSPVVEVEEEVDKVEARENSVSIGTDVTSEQGPGLRLTAVSSQNETIPQAEPKAPLSEVQGAQSNAPTPSQMATIAEQPGGPNRWLAPIFATIGVSLGIIALWLYFVRL